MTQFYLPPTHEPCIPAFIPQPQGVIALWLVLTAPAHEEMARLSSPGWLVTYRESRTGIWMTHLSTNRAWRRLTLLIETNALLLRQTTTALTCLLKACTCSPLLSLFPPVRCWQILNTTDISEVSYHISCHILAVHWSDLVTLARHHVYFKAHSVVF